MITPAMTDTYSTSLILQALFAAAPELQSAAAAAQTPAAATDLIMAAARARCLPVDEAEVLALYTALAQASTTRELADELLQGVVGGAGQPTGLAAWMWASMWVNIPGQPR